MLPSRTKSTRQGLIYSAAKKCYRTSVLQSLLMDTYVHDCMRITLSLRDHHRAQRLFTILLRGSAVNTEQLCQSIRRSKISPCAVQYAPIARLALVSAPIDRCCRAICPYCTVGSFGRHFLINVMWHGFDQSHFEYILRCYITINIISQVIAQCAVSTVNNFVLDSIELDIITKCMVALLLSLGLIFFPQAILDASFSFFSVSTFHPVSTLCEIKGIQIYNT